VQIKAIEILAARIVGMTTADAFTNIGQIGKDLSSDSQLRWLGTDKGVFHMAQGAVINALWDLFAKERSVPLWKLLSDMTPEQIVSTIDFRYISDALTPEDALAILRSGEPNKAGHEAQLVNVGVPAYTTTPGWLGYDDEKMLRLTTQAINDGFTLVKYKCGNLLMTTAAVSPKCAN